MSLKAVLNYGALNGWRLFWLVSISISSVMLVAMLRTGDWNGPAVSHLIQLSVRLAVPFLYLAFAASSLQLLFPGPLTRWLLRNRKIMGLCFAMAMAWQGLFILGLTTIYRDYYLSEVYVLRDAIEGTIGYLFLAAMTVTSFDWGRKRISPRQWRYRHKAGIYFLWAYAFGVYWWEIFYYPGPELVDYVYFLLGFAAFALRIAAWRQKQLRRQANTLAVGTVPQRFRVAAGAMGMVALALAITSGWWRQAVENLLTGHALTRIPDNYLPYWPFEPFYPLILLALAAWLSTRLRQQGRLQAAPE